MAIRTWEIAAAPSRATACLNNTDVRLPTCTLSTLSTFEVKKPSPAHLTTTADSANLAVLEGLGSGGFGVTVVRRTGVVFSGNPNSTADLCENFFNLVVPLKVTSTGPKPKTGVFRLRGTSSNDIADTDALRLECRPSTCGNHVVEPWEQCDDGNRINGDGCNQGCQSEGAIPTPTDTRTATPDTDGHPTPTQTPTNTPAGRRIPRQTL